MVLDDFEHTGAPEPLERFGASVPLPHPRQIEREPHRILNRIGESAEITPHLEGLAGLARELGIPGGDERRVA